MFRFPSFLPLKREISSCLNAHLHFLPLVPRYFHQVAKFHHHSNSAGQIGVVPFPKKAHEQPRRQHVHEIEDPAFAKQQLYEQKAYEEIMLRLKSLNQQFSAASSGSNQNNKRQLGKGNEFRKKRFGEHGHRGEQDDDHFGDRHSKVQNLFQMRHKYSAQITRLTKKQFQLMSLKDITLLLNITSSLMPVNGSGHVAGGVASVLSRKLEEADIYDSTETMIKLLNIIVKSFGAVSQHHHERAGIRRTTFPSDQAQPEYRLLQDRQVVLLLNLTMARLIEHFATATSMRRQQQQQDEQKSRAKVEQDEKRTMNDDKGETTGSLNDNKTNIDTAASSSPSSSSAGQELAYYDDSAFRQRVILRFLSKANDKRIERLFNEQLLSQLVVQILSDAKSFQIDQQQRLEQQQQQQRENSKEATTTKRGVANDRSSKKNHTDIPLSALVAVVATSICNLRIFNQTVIDFFKWAAPICISEAGLLSGSQIGYILEAFSLMGYYHAGLFVCLGEKAGELGELLREDEVARILNALSRTKLEHSKLRASLESSMRMKTLHRSTKMYSAGGLF